MVRIIRGMDIRDHGSGNIGFTNVLRVCGPSLGIPVLLLDILKGALPVFFALRYFPGEPLFHVMCAAGCIFGHSWSCFLGFRGGKMVATSLGVFLVLKWEAVLFSAVVFVLVFLLVRIVSVGSLAAALSLVAVMAIEMRWFPDSAPPLEVFLFSLLATALVFFRHKNNIRRLIAGEEKKFALGKGNAS